MTLIADAGALYAQADADDPSHKEVVRLLRSGRGPIVTGEPAVAEADYLILDRLGIDVEIDFLTDLVEGTFAVECLTHADLDEARCLVQRYRDLRFGLADASLIVLAGRHRTKRVLTFDQRAFRTVTRYRVESSSYRPRTRNSTAGRTYAGSTSAPLARSNQAWWTQLPVFEPSPAGPEPHAGRIVSAMSTPATAAASIGDLLRAHRTALGLSQEELAERAGISARAVSDIERGLRRTVYRHTAARLAQALGLEGPARAAFETAAGRRLAGTPPPATEAAAPGAVGLPPRLNRLIGREPELAAVLDAIRSGASRLLTLTGAGGMGKTRLAVEAAARCAGDFPEGAVFVPLAATREPHLVPAALSHALGMAQHHVSLLDGVIEHLRERQLLVVLDNFEHLLDAAPLVSDLLAACPSVTVLATSRAALGLSGETEILVPPLPADVASVDLFIERARAVRQSLSPDGGDRAAVVEICRSLDGVPLAIELAARRVRHLTLDALRDHLVRQLDVLSGGPRDVPERQRTMRATIAWSHDLLSQPQQRVFRRLAVFAGGSTLDAAAAVCDVEGAAGVLREISALVDQSLLALVPSADTQPRYRMLEVIREFAAEQAAASDDPAALRRRHAEHFLAMAEQAQPHLVGQGQQEWYARLDADHENMRVALRWALSEGDADIALRLAAALWMFWRQHGDFVEGSAWLSEALALPGGAMAARLGALWGAAWLAYQRGDYAHMRTIAGEHLDLARTAGDRTALRNALTEQGIALMTDGQPAEALEPLGQALDIAREAGSPWIKAMSLFNFADCTALAGDLVEASRMLEDALAEFRALGDDRFAARMLGRLALVALLQDDLARARRLAADCLQTLRDTGEKWGLAEGLEIMAGVLYREPVQAARLAGAAGALRQATGTEPMAFDRRRIAPYLARAEAALGSTSWRAALEEGSRMSPQEAIASAIE